jgi:hypothetical protein
MIGLAVAKFKLGSGRLQKSMQFLQKHTTRRAFAVDSNLKFQI